MKKLALLLAIASTLSAAAVHAQESPWLVRLRAVNVTPDNKSYPVGGSGDANTISVSSKTIPEVDISYFFTSNWATELILTYPQKHDVSLNGQNIGNFKRAWRRLLAR